MKDVHDPRGLIREAFVMDGIGLPECRTIFLDWALGVPVGDDPRDDVRALLATYADAPQDHPMVQTLKAALVDDGPAKRRGGRRGRIAD